MIVDNHGNEENNLINQTQKGEDRMDTSVKIKELMKEVEIYKQAVQDAEDALASAEMELDETLAMAFEDQ